MTDKLNEFNFFFFFFFFEDDDILEKYKSFLDKASAEIQLEFDSRPGYNKNL